MQKVFPIGLKGPMNAVLEGVQGSGITTGIIEKAIGPGKYLVVLEKGLKIEASGLPRLKMGLKVQVLPAVARAGKIKEVLSRKVLNADEPGAHWKATFSFLLGSSRGFANLRVFVQKKLESLRGKSTPAIYLLFSIRTEKHGETQWSIYLKGNQLSVQVYAEPGKRGIMEIGELIGGLEKSLKNRGFVLIGPTVVLKKPFSVPEGFRLSVEG